MLIEDEIMPMMNDAFLLPPYISEWRIRCLDWRKDLKGVQERVQNYHWALGVLLVQRLLHPTGQDGDGRDGPNFELKVK